MLANGLQHRRIDYLKEYDGAWHVRINDQWRLTFKWGESGPYDVLIEDPH